MNKNENYKNAFYDTNNNDDGIDDRENNMLIMIMTVMYW